MATIYPKNYFRKMYKQTQKASCFVLMPFDEKFREVYDIIKETLESDFVNIDCNRADDFHEPHIIETILKGIATAEFIIADLTEANANVFYELGLAHSFKNMNNVIILTQEMKYVPFDLRQFRCIVYQQSISGSKKLKDELIKTFNEVTKNSFHLKVKENQKMPLQKRLIGDENFLYELEFESPYIGYDAIKLQIHFIQLSVDKSKTKLETQLLFLSEKVPKVRINNIPWTVTLIKINDNEASLSIDKTLEKSKDKNIRFENRGSILQRKKINN